MNNTAEQLNNVFNMDKFEEKKNKKTNKRMARWLLELRQVFVANINNEKDLLVKKRLEYRLKTLERDIINCVEGYMLDENKVLKAYEVL